MEKKDNEINGTMKKRYLYLIIVLSLVFGSLLSFMLYNEWPLLTGKRIVLATRPVDPFDLFRGQYMAINYEISTIPNSGEFKEGDYVYVSLKKDNQSIWRYVSASKSRPSSGDFIKGKVERTTGSSAIVKYGIEQFFFERGADLPTTDITVEVALSDSGRARLVQLFHNGKPIEIKYRKANITS